MNLHLWSRVARELDDLLEREPAERAARLEALANEDPELARLVRDALAADEAFATLECFRATVIAGKAREK